MDRTVPTGAIATAHAPAQLGRLLTAALAALLGVVLLAGVGLSHVMPVHNATHDSRHALGFPCH